MSTLPAQPNQSLMDGLAVLQALAATEQPLSGAQLARDLGLETTRVNRLLKTLAYLGLAHRTATSQYTTGPAIHVLAAQSVFGSGLMRAAGATLEALTRHGHLVALGMRWRDMVTYLFHWSPGMSVTEAVGRMALFPATRSSIGLALLAHQSDAQIHTLYADRPTPGYADVPALLAALETVRADGYARIPAEWAADLHNIAITIGTPPYAALAVTGLPAEDAAPMRAILHTAAADIVIAYEQQRHQGSAV